jgi:predicted negative regulator of RcsB-dependent stress response
LAAQVEASVLYESLTVYVSDGDLENAESVADDLASNYANTAYAAQSNLAIAKLYMDKNRDQDAADVLNELLLMRGNKALKQIGRLRLARILLYQDKPQEVIDLLAGQDDTAFAALFAEMRGDAFAALGKITAAGDEYRIALADTSRTINRGIVQMKLVDLPDASAPAPVVDDSEEPAEPAIDGEGGESE